MAGGTGISEFDRSHQFASACRPRRMQRSKRDQSQLVAFFVADSCGTVACVRVGQIWSHAGSVMAIPALKLDVRAVGSTANRPHVNRMIQLDTSQIAAVAGAIPAERSEFRMAVLEAIDSRCV